MGNLTEGTFGIGSRTKCEHCGFNPTYLTIHYSGSYCIFCQKYYCNDCFLKSKCELSEDKKHVKSFCYLCKAVLDIDKFNEYSICSVCFNPVCRKCNRKNPKSLINSVSSASSIDEENTCKKCNDELNCRYQMDDLDKIVQSCHDENEK